MFRFTSADVNRCVDSGIAASIQFGRLESLCRFGAAYSNRLVDSGRPTRIALSIQVGRFESPCRKGLGRLESLCRSGSAVPNRFVDWGRLSRNAKWESCEYFFDLSLFKQAFTASVSSIAGPVRRVTTPKSVLFREPRGGPMTQFMCAVGVNGNWFGVVVSSSFGGDNERGEFGALSLGQSRSWPSLGPHLGCKPCILGLVPWAWPSPDLGPAWAHT